MTIARLNDPLLLAAKALTLFLQAVMAIGAVILVCISAALLFFSPDIAAELAKEGHAFPKEFPVGVLAGVFALVCAMLAALFIFFGKLRQIVNTVGEGDPFQPANAERLSLMAWLMLGVQILIVPAVAMGSHLARFAGEISNHGLTVENDFDLTGILFVIVLFILARVFRHGAQMRDELEGTV